MDVHEIWKWTTLVQMDEIDLQQHRTAHRTVGCNS